MLLFVWFFVRRTQVDLQVRLAVLKDFTGERDGAFGAEQLKLQKHVLGLLAHDNFSELVPSQVDVPF